jgi:hypothetical protein
MAVRAALCNAPLCLAVCVCARAPPAWACAPLCGQYDLTRLFAVDMEALGLRFWQFDRLLCRFLPRLSAHLAAELVGGPPERPWSLHPGPPPPPLHKHTHSHTVRVRMYTRTHTVRPCPSVWPVSWRECAPPPTRMHLHRAHAHTRTHIHTRPMRLCPSVWVASWRVYAPPTSSSPPSCRCPRPCFPRCGS